MAGTACGVELDESDLTTRMAPNSRKHAITASTRKSHARAEARRSLRDCPGSTPRLRPMSAIRCLSRADPLDGWDVCDLVMTLASVPTLLRRHSG